MQSSLNILFVLKLDLVGYKVDIVHLKYCYNFCILEDMIFMYGTGTSCLL